MKLNAEAHALFNDPAFQKKFMEPQMFESMAASPEEFAQFIRSEMQSWAKIIREQHITLE